MSKYEFNDLVNHPANNNHKYLTDINTGTSTTTGATIGNESSYPGTAIGTTSSYPIGSYYTINIPDGEISFSELNESMNVLKNAFDHIQIKIKALEQNKESEKINKRNIFKK